MAAKKSEGNAFAAKAKEAEIEKNDIDAMAEGATEEKRTRRKSTGRVKPEIVPEQSVKSGNEMTAVFTGPLVTANFKIPADARKKLKKYAVENDTTTVAVFLEMIAALPDV